MSSIKSIETLQLELKATIDATGCLEVAQLSSRDGDIRALCRATDEGQWLRILQSYLPKDESAPFYSFIGKKYFLMNNDLTAAWVVMLQSDDLASAVGQFREMLQASANFVQNRVPRTNKPKPGTPQPGEPESYRVNVPFGGDFNKRFDGGRVRSLTTRK